MEAKSLSYYHVIILAPLIESNDENLKYYYDYTQSKAEYEKVFSELNIKYHWIDLTLKDYKQILDKLFTTYPRDSTIYFNLCDGDGINGAPGIEIIDYMDLHNVIYTGATHEFYKLTTSKIIMKECFDKCNVPTPQWLSIDYNNIDLVLDQLKLPIIIKPAVSGGSMGVSIRNVVNDKESCIACLDQIYEGYNGWNLHSGGIIAEEFIKGREFTTFLIGDSTTDLDSLIIYPAVERIFNAKLKPEEQFLSFDRLWETYETESPMGDNEFLFNYYPVDESTNLILAKLSKEAYLSVQGNSYTRIDIRQDNQTGHYYVLEVNAQCGLSEDENYTSIGAILRYSNESFTQMCVHILNDALYHQS